MGIVGTTNLCSETLELATQTKTPFGLVAVNWTVLKIEVDGGVLACSSLRVYLYSTHIFLFNSHHKNEGADD